VTPTRQELEVEIREQQLDLEAFQQARDLVRIRVHLSTETQRLLTPLHTWSGSDAVLGSLDLVIHAIERTISELREMRDKTVEVAVELNPRLVGPPLRLVKGNDDEHQG
jgi:hypothetical protein